MPRLMVGSSGIGASDVHVDARLLPRRVLQEERERARAVDEQRERRRRPAASPSRAGSSRRRARSRAARGWRRAAAAASCRRTTNWSPRRSKVACAWRRSCAPMSALMGTPSWRAMGDRSSTSAGTSFTSTRSKRRLTHAGSWREFESSEHLARAGGDEREDALAVELARDHVGRAEGHAVDARGASRPPPTSRPPSRTGAGPRRGARAPRPRGPTGPSPAGRRACASSSSAACSMSPENQ